MLRVQDHLIPVAPTVLALLSVCEGDSPKRLRHSPANRPKCLPGSSSAIVGLPVSKASLQPDDSLSTTTSRAESSVAAIENQFLSEMGCVTCDPQGIIQVGVWSAKISKTKLKVLSGTESLVFQRNRCEERVANVVTLPLR
jgi:hypothetical protein